MNSIEDSLISRDITKSYNRNIDNWIIETFGTRENAMLYKDIYYITQRKINEYETEYCIVNKLDGAILSRMINKLEIKV